MIKHSILYVFSKGVPSIISFFSILVYTRMLEPAEYGEYAIYLSIINLSNIILFQWLRVSLLRKFSTYDEYEKIHFKKTILFGFFLTTSISLILIPISLQLMNINFIHTLLLIANIWSLGWFEINQTLFRSKLQPIKFGIITLVKVSVGFIISIIFIKLGFGVTGVLMGILLGTFVSVIEVTLKEWKVIESKVKKDILIEVFKYGLPLTVTFTMTFLLQFSDRFFLKWISGVEYAGYYAVASDLASQSISMIMMMVNLGALPLAIRAFENEGIKSAQKHLKNNYIIMLIFSMPILAGGILLSKEIGDIILSGEYSTVVADVLPYLLVGTLLAGLKSFYFDQSFQIGNKTTVQIIPVAVSSFFSITLNILLIPQFGIKGAAISSIISYSISLLLTYYLGKRYFPLMIPWNETMKIIFASLIFSLFLLMFKSTNYFELILALVGALILYVTLIYSMNVGNIKELFKRRFPGKLREISK